jgi:NNP family nitrate/nitrite transporter-like MFS transporter
LLIALHKGPGGDPRGGFPRPTGSRGASFAPGPKKRRAIGKRQSRDPMDFRDFKKAGHLPTLIAAFLYFDFSFMVWVTLGPLMVYIAKDLGFSTDEKFTLVAVPILAGAVLRIVLGTLADRFGARRTALGAQAIVIAAIVFTWMFGLRGMTDIEILGIFLGLAGASFAVALPQASRWYPPRYQGVVMGLAGAGNMGVVLDALIVPSLAQSYGWQNAFGFLLVPLLVTFAVYAFFAKDAPGAKRRITWEAYRAVLADRDCWWFMFFYFITFGGFVGLANALPLYFTIQYHVSGVAAGVMAAVVVLFGSLFRPVGGYVADRIGGIAALTVLFAIVSIAYFTAAFLPGAAPPIGPDGKDAVWTLAEMPAATWIAVLLFSGGVLSLGMGNGAVFQLIPQRFAREIGTVTGLVGCAGGIGGFFLAKTLGLSKSVTGDFGAGFLFVSLLACIGLAGLMLVKQRWRTTWGAEVQARV